MIDNMKIQRNEVKALYTHHQYCEDRPLCYNAGRKEMVIREKPSPEYAYECRGKQEATMVFVEDDAVAAEGAGIRYCSVKCADSSCSAAYEYCDSDRKCNGISFIRASKAAKFAPGDDRQGTVAVFLRFTMSSKSVLSSLPYLYFSQSKQHVYQ
jgi:hypothetical protein